MAAAGAVAAALLRLGLVRRDGQVAGVDRHVYLYLANGRILVRRDSGEIDEADASERFAACLLLALDEGGTLGPARGLELSPPKDN